MTISNSPEVPETFLGDCVLVSGSRDPESRGGSGERGWGWGQGTGTDREAADEASSGTHLTHSSYCSR